MRPSGQSTARGEGTGADVSTGSPIRYTAALDAIKKDRKDRVADLKAEKAHLDHLKADKDRAETVRRQKARLRLC